MNAPVPAAPAGNRDRREVIREEPLMRRAIVDAVGDAGRSVPEIAAAIGHPQDEVLLWVMGMRRYGYLTEIKAVGDDGYFRYQQGPRAKDAR